MNGHGKREWTRATVVRAGRTTTLVVLTDWYNGKILASVPTALVAEALRVPAASLPGRRLWVYGNTSAPTEDELGLTGWTVVPNMSPAAATSPHRAAA